MLYYDYDDRAVLRFYINILDLLKKEEERWWMHSNRVQMRACNIHLTLSRYDMRNQAHMTRVQKYGAPGLQFSVNSLLLNYLQIKRIFSYKLANNIVVVNNRMDCDGAKHSLFPSGAVITA